MYQNVSFFSGSRYSCLSISFIKVSVSFSFHYSESLYLPIKSTNILQSAKMIQNCPLVNSITKLYVGLFFTLAISKCSAKVRVLFFRATTYFTRQVAHFTRSWSCGKMLAFQPRGFVFEPVGMRIFFTSIPKQKVLTFFGTMRLFGFVRLFNEFFPPKSPPFDFF